MTHWFPAPRLSCSICLSLAIAASGCSSDSQKSGSGGASNMGGVSASNGGTATSSGGASTSSGGVTAASGGVTSTSGGITSTSGGANTSSGGGTSVSGGANSASGGANANAGSTAGGASNGGGANTNGGASSAKGGATSANGGQSTTNGGSGGAATSSGGVVGTAGSTGKAEVRFVGRVDKSDSAGPRFAWSGSGVVASFNGTQVSVKLSSGQFTVLVDGMQKTKLVANGSMASLATGLAAGAHTVELYRRTEANQGETQFLGFDFGGGQLLAPPPAPTRRIEIVGDSITCGYGDEGTSASCMFSPDTENHYLSYGAIAARNVNAELITVAWSGEGIIYNYGDDANSHNNPLPTYYERTLPNRSTSQWDFSTWQADAVVINLGTNDLSTAEDPTQAQFEGAYKDFVTKIRSKYPNAWILLTNGSMLSGTELTTVRTYLKDVATAMNDPKVKTFDIQPQDGADGYGCDWHPSLATHRKMADQLTSVLKSTLGW